MSGAALSINSSIIGISFDRMNVAKKKIYRAQEEAQGERDSLSRAISSLQVEDGRLRQRAEALNRLRSRINNRMAELQRMGSHVEYAVQRFKEVDNQRAQKIKTGGCEVRKAVGIPKESGIFGNIVSGLVSIVDRGARAWYNTNKAVIDGAKFVFGKGWEAIKYGAKAVGDFYEEHKVLINNIATIALEAVSIALTVAAVAALSVTGVGLVVAVGIAAAGIAYSASNIIDSGVKIYNYCTTGEEKGFNPLQKGFQAVLGDELGEKVYNYAGIAVAVADVGAGAVSMLKAAKQAKTAFSLTKSVKEAGNVLKEFGQKGIQQLKNTAKEMVESGSQLFKKSESLVDAATGTRFSDKMLDFGKVDMPVVKETPVQSNFKAVMNGSSKEISETVAETGEVISKNKPYTDLKNKASQVTTNAEKGQLAEEMADLVFERAGYEKLASKVGSNNGFDGVYVKYDKSGEVNEIVVNDLIINESKFSSSGKVKLGKTVTGFEQMDPDWIMMNIDKMLNSSDSAVRKTGQLLLDNLSKIRTKLNLMTPDGKNKWFTDPNGWGQ